MSVDAIRASEPRPCPVCASTDDSDVFAESTIDEERLSGLSFASRKTPEYMHHRYVRCPVCALIYVSPAPPADAVMEAYQQAEFDATDESALAARTYAKLLDAVPAATRASGTLVDIGAADGAFLVAAADYGFADRIGFEPSAAPVAAASPLARPLLREEPLVAGSVPPGSASVVTCFQTIEHVETPLELCRLAATTLRDDGALILVCHDARALSARLLGTHSPIFDLEHLQLFTRPSLRELVRRAGFRRVRIRPLVNAYPLAYWTRLAPVPGKEPLLSALETTGLGGLTVPLPAGNLVVTAWR